MCHPVFECECTMINSAVGVDGPARVTPSALKCFSISFSILALTIKTYLRDFPLLSDKKGGSLNISFSAG